MSLHKNMKCVYDYNKHTLVSAYGGLLQYLCSVDLYMNIKKWVLGPRYFLVFQAIVC